MANIGHMQPVRAIKHDMGAESDLKSRSAKQPSAEK